jgi:amino acid adenylation domain-containing protein
MRTADEDTVSAGLPLSAAQRHLWVADQMQPGSGLYTIPLAFRLHGELDEAALVRAWSAVLGRHEILQTVYTEENGVLAQRAARDADCRATVSDLSGLAPRARGQELERQFAAAISDPFDLAAAPPARMTLFRLAADDHVLLLCVHHIAFDGASAGILLDELAACYAAFAAGSVPAAARAAARYADFCLSQEQDAERAQHLDFWRRMFAQLPPLLQLETDRPRPSAQTHRGASLRFALSPAVQAKVIQLSAEAGATPFTTLLAAFYALLARYTGQTDLVVGVPVLGRPSAEWDEVIGMFANLVPVRADLSGDLPFRLILDRVTDAAMAAFEHMDTQFGDIVEAVAAERDPAYMPLAQVTFGMLSERAGSSLHLPGITADPLPVDRGAAEFDLSFEILAAGDGWTADIEYNTDLWDRPTVSRLAAHWQTLLAAAVAQPDTPLSALPLLTPAERRQQLDDWNSTDVNFGEPRCLHDMFREQAARTPLATAVVFGERRLSYRELDERANQLAHLLTARGAGPEVSVGVCMPRSEQTIVAFLAVLKSGAVYLPLDPEYPPDRLAFMVADADMALLVTDSKTAAELDVGAVPAVLVDADLTPGMPGAAAPPQTAVTAANLSCAFYTSGSSGRPKCAALTHANYFNYVSFWRHRYLDRTPMRVHLQMTSFAFDIFIADASRALLTGATLVVCPREVVMAPERLYDLMIREHVNSAEFITPILAALVDHVQQHGQDLTFLDILVAGSDIWYAADFARARALCGPATRMIAAYGLSETSIDNSTFDDRDQDDELSGIVPIGRPADNTRLYVLDERLELLPAGMAGELFVGGAGVGRGYLHRPGLTADRYIPDPFGPHPGGRLYKSGDLARYRPDGVLEILGRVDNQVKVGGFRIELGEIESALRSHPVVDKAVVVVRAATGGDGRLVGYYTASQPDNGAAAPDLTGYLRDRLPGYMVPAALVKLDELPLSANGKVDRRSLPAPEGVPSAASRPPRTPTEQVLAGIWSDILGGIAVGVEDDFFALGGRSLLMAQVVSRVREVWGVELPLRAIYQHPSVAALAGQVAALRSGGGATAVPPLRRSDRAAGELADVSFAQQQLWFHDQMEPGSATYNVPVMYRLDGPLDVDALSRSLRALVGRHEILRTVYRAAGGQPMQTVREAGQWAPGFTDLSGLPDDAADVLLAEAKRAAEAEPFDLSEGPLIRCSIVRLGRDRHALLLTMHHSVTDGWSLGLMFEELSARYAAQVRGEPADLPEPALQYADYARWQRSWLTDEMLAGQAEYWRGVLDGAPEATVLPAAHQRAAVTGYEGGLRSFDLPGELAAELGALSGSEHATVFMTLFAAFAVLLGRAGGQTDIVVGVPLAGRSYGGGDVERMLGFFVNVLPLRVDLSGDVTFRDVLRQVREVALAAYEHEVVPFEKVVERLRPARAPFRNPVFQTVFSLDSVTSKPLSLPGVVVSDIPFESTTAKFDLLLEMTEEPGRLSGGFSYRTELFDSADIDRIVTDWQALLAAVAADPGALVSSLPVRPVPGRQRDWPMADEASPEEYIPPRTPLEELVGAVWADALGLPQVGALDDFFVLGGYSLLGSQLAARLEDVLGVRVPLRSLFLNPTVEQLSAWIESVMPAADLARVTEEITRVAAMTDAEVLDQLACEREECPGD